MKNNFTFDKQTIEKEKLKQQYLVNAKKQLPKAAYDLAKKMNIKIDTILLNMHFSNNKRQAYESAVAQIVGLYGSIITTNYLTKQGYQVINEKSIKYNNDSRNVDIYFQQNDCEVIGEVKTISKIILNKSLLENEEVDKFKKIPREQYSFNGGDGRFAFLKTANKLIKQIDYLCDYRDNNGQTKIKIFVFQDSFIDPALEKKFAKQQVETVVVPVKIDDLIEVVAALLQKIYNYGEPLFQEENIIKQLIKNN